MSDGGREMWVQFKLRNPELRNHPPELADRRPSPQTVKSTKVNLSSWDNSIYVRRCDWIFYKNPSLTP